MKQVSDEQLMQQYAQGDFEAFSELYARHKGPLFRYFLRHIGERQRSEDLFQDVWDKVVTSAHRYQVNASFRTWLYTLAHNRLVDQYRHLKVVERTFATQHDDVEHVGTGAPGRQLDAIAQQQNVEALKHCLTRLPQVQRDSFLLKEEAGLKAAQIADVLGCTVDATKSRLRYAYQSLRTCLSLKLGGIVA